MGGMGPAGGAIGLGAMPGMGGMGAMGGMGGQPMVGPDGEPEGTLKGDVTIKRVAYFAVDEGRFVAFEDTVNKKITKILLPEMEMGMGMGGPGGPGGMPGMGGGFGMGGMTEMKPLDYRGLNHLDATSLMGSLVGAGGGMGMGGGTGGMIGGPGGMLGGMMGAVTGYAGALNTAMAGGAPGMPPGGGMMPPGGGPGAPGMGMMQMEPPTPAVINIDTTLSVEEVKQIAGHSLARQTNL
jgi:hypothetical protein